MVLLASAFKIDVKNWLGDVKSADFLAKPVPEETPQKCFHSQEMVVGVLQLF